MKVVVPLRFPLLHLLITGSVGNTETGHRSTKLKTAPEAHLILETKGFDPLTGVKKNAAERWVAAVNADDMYGQWLYAICRRPEDVPAAMAAGAARAGA
ncbi:MAG: hypothetical protein ACLQU1_32065 [Bryobacteraceae bacterium]